MLLVLHAASPFVYSNNDDFYQNALVSGALTGVPESHMLSMSYVIGLLLSALYSLLPHLPWYGLFLTCSMGLAMFAVLSALVKREPCRTAKVLIFCSVLVLYGSLLSRFFLDVQYTLAAGIVCSAALACFALSAPQDKTAAFLRENIPSLLLFALGYCIRSKVFLMLLPLLVFLSIAKAISQKKIRKNILPFLLLCSLVVLLLFLSDLTGYSGKWRAFRTYTHNRETVYDYNGYPDYDAAQSLYQSLGITRSSYEASAHHYALILDSHTDQKAMASLAAASSSIQTSHDLSSMLQSFLEHFRKTDRPMSYVVAVLYLTVLLVILPGGNKKQRLLLPLLAVFLGQAVIWGYLLLVGRSPFRVSQIVWLAQFFLLLPLLTEAVRCPTAKPGRLSALLPAICCLLPLLCALRYGLVNLRSVRADVTARLAYSETDQEIQAYLDSHPDQFYLCDTFSMSYFTGELFAAPAQHAVNRVLLGSWMANSPWYDRIFTTAGIGNPPGTAALNHPAVCFLFMDTAEADKDGTQTEASSSAATQKTPSWQYVADYYQEAYPDTRITLTTTDRYTCKNGVSFHILKLTCCP